MNLVLDNVPLVLQRNFSELLREGIGLVPISWADIGFHKSCVEHNSSFCYYYTLRIPFGGHRLTWDVIFDPQDLTLSPDFNFNDENFHFSTNSELIVECVPSLVAWDVKNPSALLRTLREFLELYKKQQIDHLRKDNIYSHLLTEFLSLTSEVTSEDVELFLGVASASIIVKMKVDISSLPEYVQEEKNLLLNPGEDNLLLKIAYVKLDGSKVNTTVQLSPRLKQVLDVDIPHFTEETSLVAYVDTVRKTFRDHVKSIEQHYKLKKELINCICVHYHKCLVEFDAETFNKAVLLMEIDGYFALIHIEIEKGFPKDCPVVKIQSPYCDSPAHLCIDTVDTYPYSPRWPPNTILERLMKYLIDNIPKFRNHRH